MSDTMNPLFDNERELLERQKEEYKKALMGDVDQIKTQGQQIGKKVAIAGGVLFAGLLLRSLFTGDSKKKSKKREKDTLRTRSLSTQYTDDVAGYNSFVHEQEDDYTLSSERTPHAHHSTHSQTGVDKSFMNSDLMKVLTQQLSALLMVYLTKKVEEYLSSVSKNNDIAAIPIEVTEVETIAYTIPQEDAIRQTP